LSSTVLDNIKQQVIGYNGCRLGLAAEKRVVPLACLHLHRDMTTRDGGSMAHEEWRDVVGYEGYYQVSNLGRVRSLDRTVNARFGNTRIKKGKILTPSKYSNGELYVRFYHNGKTSCFKVHRLVAETFNPDEDFSLFVIHINGNKHDNRVENLAFVDKLPSNIVNLPDEEWKPIVGYEGLYEVSNMGRVKSLNRTLPNKTGGKRQWNETLLHQNIRPNGYAFVSLSANGETSYPSVHRLVAKAFLEAIEGKEYVDHINCVKSDNRVINLRYVTPSENNRYAFDNGLCDTDAMSRRMREYVAKHGTATPPKPVIRNDGVWFESGSAAARAIGAGQSDVSAVARGIRKSVKGYTFRFAE